MQLYEYLYYGILTLIHVLTVIFVINFVLNDFKKNHLESGTHTINNRKNK